MFNFSQKGGTYISVWIIIGLYGPDPVQHGVVFVRLEQVFGAIEGLESEHVLFLGVIVCNVDQTRLDGDGLIVEVKRVSLESNHDRFG